FAQTSGRRILPLNMAEIYPLLDRASVAVGRLDGLSVVLPDPQLFLYMYVRKEALLSSQIEGTQSSFSDLLIYENDEVPGVPVDDVAEVSSYVAAMNHGLERLRDFPLSLRLIKEIHTILMTNARGGTKQPGEFRTTQNWIGGSRPGNARFVPPPPEYVMECLDNFEKFLHDERVKMPALIKAAVAHVQFETIHPFLDGNGRTARLFSHAYLKEIGIGSSLWSVSRGLARTSAKYKEMLAYADSDRKGDLDGRGSLSLIGLQDFCIYFLEQCIDQTEFMASLLKLTELLERIEFYCRNEASKGRMHKKAFRLLKEALIMGEFSRGNAADILDMSAASSSKIISELVSEGILTSETPKGKVRLGFPYKVLKYWLPGVYPDL
ncbi:MAG: Fic family protein, partial [Burkholderiaceae bacterium]|nr:Fic family protein [Burkholderiaceae bacterium]